MDAFVWVALGLAALIGGGEALVRGAVSVAARIGLSPLLIGVTLVGFGTSAPELVTSVQAALAGSAGIAIGNVVGSNIGNVLLILGLAALFAPVTVLPGVLARDGGVMLGATLLAVALAQLGAVGRGAGLALILGLAAYLTATLVLERRKARARAVYVREAEAVPGPELGIRAGFGVAVLGLILAIPHPG